MFKKKPVEPTELDKLIDETTSQMRNLDPITEADAFDQMTKKLSRLTKLKKAQPSKPSVSPDTLAIILGNVAITAVVVFHERMANIGTRAFQFHLPTRIR